MNGFRRKTLIQQARLWRRSPGLLAALLVTWATVLSAVPAAAEDSPAQSNQAPAGNGKGAVGKNGELGEQKIVGTSKEKLEVGKMDPPGAFNLEDIQNFPEDRLLPVLNNPLTFEEGRDFTTLMDFQEEQLFHPWLPEMAHGPFLNMKTSVDKVPQDWTFSIIDQGGATVAKQEGRGNPPAALQWNGEDSVRDHIAVDTVYIPQLATSDKEGYHHTYMGTPSQFSSLVFKEKGRTVIELSSKRLFQEKKTDWTKEAPVLLEKLTDALREDGLRSFTIQPYDADPDLAKQRQTQLKNYLVDALHIPAENISTPETETAEKRGNAMSISASGGSQ